MFIVSRGVAPPVMFRPLNSGVRLKLLDQILSQEPQISSLIRHVGLPEASSNFQATMADCSDLDSDSASECPNPYNLQKQV